MRVLKKGKKVSGVRTGRYILEIEEDNQIVRFSAVDGRFYYLLSLISGCDKLGQTDECSSIKIKGISKIGNKYDIKLLEDSSIREHKEYHFLCEEDSMEFYYRVKGNTLSTMQHRAKIYQISMPGIPIDTDGQYTHDFSKDWIEMMKEQAKVGIPCLYHAENIAQTQPYRRPVFRKFQPDDYIYIARVWDKYRRDIQKSH
ncbi:MAG: hypothetical protein HQ541_19175 [Mariniphaga sp.]|nr:hypothetical protein [Mariniphaga sp.]